MNRQRAELVLTSSSRWLTQHPLASLWITVACMLGVATPFYSPDYSMIGSGRWPTLSWLFVVLMAYQALSVMRRRRLDRVFRQGAPIMRWMMATSVFFIGYAAAFFIAAPVALMWIGFGIALALLIFLTLTRSQP